MVGGGALGCDFGHVGGAFMDGVSAQQVPTELSSSLSAI